MHLVSSWESQKYAVNSINPQDPRHLISIELDKGFFYGNSTDVAHPLHMPVNFIMDGMVLCTSFAYTKTLKANVKEKSQ